jgi:hypothetical protein
MAITRAQLAALHKSEHAKNRVQRRGVLAGLSAPLAIATRTCLIAAVLICAFALARPSLKRFDADPAYGLNRPADAVIAASAVSDALHCWEVIDWAEAQRNVPGGIPEQIVFANERMPRFYACARDATLAQGRPTQTLTALLAASKAGYTPASQ